MHEMSCLRRDLPTETAVTCAILNFRALFGDSWLIWTTLAATNFDRFQKTFFCSTPLETCCTRGRIFRSRFEEKVDFSQNVWNDFPNLILSERGNLCAHGPVDGRARKNILHVLRSNDMMHVGSPIGLQWGFGRPWPPDMPHFVRAWRRLWSTKFSEIWTQHAEMNVMKGHKV